MRKSPGTRVTSVNICYLPGLPVGSWDRLCWNFWPSQRLHLSVLERGCLLQLSGKDSAVSLQVTVGGTHLLLGVGQRRPATALADPRLLPATAGRLVRRAAPDTDCFVRASHERVRKAGAAVCAKVILHPLAHCSGPVLDPRSKSQVQPGLQRRRGYQSMDTWRQASSQPVRKPSMKN